METPEIAKDIDDVIAKLKKRIPKIVVIDDKGKMKHAIKALSDFNVRAIVPYEETVPYGDKLAKILKIAGNDPKTSLLRKNKDSLNQLLAKKGIRSIKSLILKSNTTVDKIVAYFKNHFPLVLKPVYGSSSVNVFVVKNQKELAEKINFFRTLDRKTLKILGDIVIQEFITGTEYVANYISNNGRHILTDLWYYEKFKDADGKVIYHRTNLIKKLTPLTKKIAQYGFAVLNAMKYNVGPTHLEIKVDRHGPVLIEANLRIMGGLFFKNEPLVGKYPTYEFALLAYFNSPLIEPFFKNPVYQPNPNHVTAYTLYSNQSYKIKSIVSDAYMKKTFPTFQQWKLYVKAGGFLQKTIDYITFPGEIEFASPDAKKIEADCAKLNAIEKTGLQSIFIKEPLKR